METTLVILIHGFNVSDGGEDTVGKLKKFYLQHPNTTVRSFTYQSQPGIIRDLLMTRFCNDDLAEDLANMITKKYEMFDNIIVVGHSNGAAIAHLASRMLVAPVHVDKYVYIQPALKAHLPRSESVSAIDIYHNRSDRVVGLSKWLFWRASARPWGEMGSVGYIGPEDPHTLSLDTENSYEPASGHSGIFEENKILFWGPLIVEMSFKFH